MKMKKYYMCETGDEVKFGDEISVELECTFKDDEEMIQELINLGIIEEDEEDEDLIDFNDDDIQAFKEAVAQDIEELNHRTTALEDSLAKKDKQIDVLQKAITELLKKKKAK